MSYLPTLILIFTDPRSRATVYQTHVKFRLTQQIFGESFTPEDLEGLRGHCQSVLEGLSYTTGELRCKYVSSNRSKWKTTVFAFSLEDATKVFDARCRLTGEDFDIRHVSYTRGREGVRRGTFR